MPQISRNNQHQRWRGRFWRYAPLVFWIVVIFVASSNTGSMSNTSRIIRPLLLLLFPSIDEPSIYLVQIYIRKTAHFVFYFVLGALAARAFALSSLAKINRFWFLFAFVLVVFVASLDETNQSFMASRTSSVTDVLLDAAGGGTAILLTYFVKIWYDSDAKRS